MVDEFSSFARMPAAKLASNDLKKIIESQITLHTGANSNIDFHLEMPNDPILVLCDDHQIRQMITNLVQNSIDSITARGNNEYLDKGIVKIKSSIKSNFCHLKIIDNGIGLPPEISNRLTEPYVTTREKGTGLGLAIVAKIVEDHGGILKNTGCFRTRIRGSCYYNYSSC